MKIKPLSPSDISENMDEIFPGVIIEAVNNLLRQNFRNGSAILRVRDIIKESHRIDSSMTTDKIFTKNWMEFESIYTKVGWKVEYEYPARGDSFDSYFRFSK